MINVADIASIPPLKELVDLFFVTAAISGVLSSVFNAFAYVHYTTGLSALYKQTAIPKKDLLLHALVFGFLSGCVTVALIVLVAVFTFPIFTITK